MKITVKLPLALAAALALVLAAALFGIQQLNRAIGVYAGTVAANHAHELAVGAALGEFKVQVQEWKNVLLRGKDPAQLERYWAAFEKTEHDVAARTDKLIAALPAGAGKDLLQRFGEAHKTMGAGYRKGLAAFKAANFDAAAGDAAVAGMDRAPSKLFDEANERIAADSAAVAAQAAVDARRATLISLVLMGVVCAVAVGGGFVFIRATIRPIQHAVDVAGAVAAGDLSVPVKVHGRDEISEVMASLREMQQRLAAVVGSVRQNADSVATASAQIAQGNLDLSSRTEEQASALEQTAASMEELASTVRQNADNARQANQMAAGASEVAQRGGAVVGQVVDTMAGITESSQRIAEIIGVIDGIAFQTNILALNAAVEAARAGEQGRGFAVVAGEVRSLAQRSAEAAKEIKSLISVSVERVGQGSELVDQAGKTMAEIVAAIRRVTDLMGEISAASTEQSAGVAQVGEAITQMDQATQQNAALVEESAAAAESLKVQAGQMVQTVSVFKLAAGAAGSPASPVAAAPARPAAPVGHTWHGEERRGPQRATNVKRLAAPKPAAQPDAAAPAAPRNGTDDWESF
jgi:methyl-accepting chemotaxis protein-1 (serine sensor receptor)